MIGDYRYDLVPEVECAEEQILMIIRDAVPSARLKRIGPIDFYPPVWACWIVTHTDVERDMIAEDTELNSRLAAAAQMGFPPDSFTFQSDETVERDYEGSWFYAMR